MTQPTISIITVNLNNSEGLKQTLTSINEQPTVAYEHIIIDGGSTDGSLSIIEEYSQTSSHLAYWVSEKDKGIYNAMNKGIIKSSGMYLLFLNSGDFLEPGILGRVNEQLSGEDIIFGDLYFFDKGQKQLKIYPPPPFKITQIISQDFNLPHPASFIRRELFDEEGYNEHYKIVSDWEFWIKSIVFKNCTIKHIPIVISNFADGGVSSIVENQLLISQEKEDVFNRLFPSQVLECLREFATIENSPLCETIFQTRHTRRFQHRAKKIISFYYKINCLFTKKRQ